MTAGMIYLYKTLSLGLAYPQEGNWMMFEGLLSACGDLLEGDLSSAMRDFKSSFLANRHRVRDMGSEYLRIFDMGRLISPYETEYLQEKISRKPFELADIAGFYQAFGFDVSDGAEHREPVDHVAVELEFMAILAYKERYAGENHQDDRLAIVREAQKKFLHDHLARWGFFYCSRIREIECEDYYKHLGKVLHAVLTAECETHGLDVAGYEKEITQEAKRGMQEEELSCGQQFSGDGILNANQRS